MVEAILLSVPDLAPFDASAEFEVWKRSGRGLIEPNGEAGFRQRAWDSPLIESIQKTLIGQADQFSRARLLYQPSPNLVPGLLQSRSPA